MSLPELTIIIPTLKRPDTIYWTLKTVLEQDYSNFHILVSDNFSNDNTKEIVDSFKDARIRYITTDRKLSMSYHWEFALSHVTDGYVTILGDDDGILPGGLSKIAEIIQKHQPQAIGWRFGNFNWKGLDPYFMVPLGSTYRIIDSKKEAIIILKKSIYATIEFPSLYGGFIKKDLIDHLKVKYGGSFFHSRIPDFFSGAIVAANVTSYIRIEHPITLNATSKHSTGLATVLNTISQTAYNDLKKNDETNINFHADLVFMRAIAIAIAEAMMQAGRLEKSFPAVDLKNVLNDCMVEASMSDNKEKYDEMVTAIREMGDLNKLDEYTEKLIKSYPYNPMKKIIKDKFSPLTNTLYIDTSLSNINNVYDACQIASLFVASRITKQKFRIVEKLNIFNNYLKISKIKSGENYLKYFNKAANG